MCYNIRKKLLEGRYFPPRIETYNSLINLSIASTRLIKTNVKEKAFLILLNLFSLLFFLLSNLPTFFVLPSKFFIFLPPFYIYIISSRDVKVNKYSIFFNKAIKYINIKYKI